MAHLDEITIFNNCIERLHAGQSIEDCLRVYPEYATTLRPLLEMAQAIHHATPPIPAGTQARVKARTLMTSARRISWPTRLARLSTIAALLAVMFFVVQFTMLNDENNTAQSTPPVIVTIASPTVTPSPTHSPTPTVTETASLAAPVLTDSPTPTDPPSPTPPPTHTPTVSPIPACRFEVTVSSASLRTGPGTGYPVVGFAYVGENFLVLERHRGAAWLKVDVGTDPTWIATNVGELSGDCTDLPVSDQPVIEGEPPDTPGDPSTPDSTSSPDTADDDQEPAETDEPDDHDEPETEEDPPDDPDESNDHDEPDEGDEPETEDL